MKYLFTLLATVALFGSQLSAESLIPPGKTYAKYQLGFNQTYKDITKPALSYGLALGYEIDDVGTCTPHIETEFFLRNQMSKENTGIGGHISLASALLNVGFTVNEMPIFKPFCSVGLGYAEHEALLFSEGFVASTAVRKLAFQVKGGVKYELADNYHVSLEYKYLGMKDLEYNHGLFLGLVQYF